MTVRFTPSFVRLYEQLPLHIRVKVNRQVQRLAQDIRHPGLRTRKMAGQQEIWEARVDEHYRMTFQVIDDQILLRRVGTHAIYRQP